MWSRRAAILFAYRLWRRAASPTRARPSLGLDSNRDRPPSPPLRVALLYRRPTFLASPSLWLFTRHPPRLLARVAILFGSCYHAQSPKTTDLSIPSLPPPGLCSSLSLKVSASAEVGPTHGFPADLVRLTLRVSMTKSLNIPAVRYLGLRHHRNQMGVKLAFAV
ncbi:hypothetical protein OH76DRAFT_1410656 [Lentinus brumalis]|uniref:Uncharacterized protein n=1 Tax=Lentinus brumalis TaxID=2498619 RepID=A0A371CRJ4_9APHY|nr:hypothetical protein OH76DRAFT_1410656 [Polyporus brumalis]